MVNLHDWCTGVAGQASHPMSFVICSVVYLAAAIAGVIGLLRTQGSFALSVRYALCLALPSSRVEADPAVPYPTMREYEEIARTFEKALDDLLGGKGDGGTKSLEDIGSNEDARAGFVTAAEGALREKMGVLPTARGGARGLGRLAKFVSFGELSLFGRKPPLAHWT